MRLDSLTGLRWWAAFAVFLYHMKNLAPVPLLGEVARFGNHGVAFFFVLSGFVLTWSAGTGGTTVRNFYWRRFARIYPAHVVALILAIPVFYSLAPDPGQPWVKTLSIAPLLLSLVLLQSWSSDPVILFSGNPAAWTLGVEAFFYLLHPWGNLVLRRTGRRGALVVLAAVIAVIMAHRLAALHDEAGALAQLPTPVARLGEFALGMVVARLVQLGAGRWVRPWLGYGALLAFIAWCVLSRRHGWADAWSLAAQRFELQVLAVLFALLILGIANRDLAQGRSWLRHRLMVRLGAWSFAFYLVHATVMYTVRDVVGFQSESVGNLLWYPPVLAIALALAWALYRFIEHPVERRMRHWGNAHLA
ncbi:acyltransferase [Actinomyces slackii]|uniref:Uncharacterized protein conserved in bacteria n=2 Tax=Actinomyces slackii TaxID=52774 RepID=A0A3S5EM90_9ACTO|nr:Uncharacterized protein conserved in bacteria [Actinomyces slackii]